MKTKRPGPIEQMYIQSDDPQKQQLCKMNNPELLHYMDELSESGKDMDEAAYNAAERLLDERAPIERPSAEDVAKSFERFKRNHPEFFQSK